ncbi:MAG: cupin [Patescibacteria group bacterium]|nr:cupin [Patescibacteria group bacterium]
MPELSIEPYSKETPKPWGKEVLLSPDDLPYVGKLLFINAGARLSLQYHDEKEETQCLISGMALLWLENDEGEIEKIEMEPECGYTIRPNRKHRLEGIEDAVVFEASTPEIGTTFRVEDDYERPDETEELRAEDNRGWNPES